MPPWRNGEETCSINMISFSTDPVWGGLLYSVYYRHEKPTWFPLPDSLVTCSYHGPVETDIISFGATISCEVIRWGNSVQLVLDTVRATSVILLLGVGSFVCYRLYRTYWPGVKGRSPKSPAGRRGRGFLLSFLLEEEQHLVEDLEEEGDQGAVEGKYFGPSSPAPTEEEESPINSPAGNSCTSDDLHDQYLADKSASVSVCGDDISTDGEPSYTTDSEERNLYVRKPVRSRMGNKTSTTDGVVHYCSREGVTISRHHCQHHGIRRRVPITMQDSLSSTPSSMESPYRLPPAAVGKWPWSYEIPELDTSSCNSGNIHHRYGDHRTQDDEEEDLLSSLPAVKVDDQQVMSEPMFVGSEMKTSPSESALQSLQRTTPEGASDVTHHSFMSHSLSVDSFRGISHDDKVKLYRQQMIRDESMDSIYSDVFLNNVSEIHRLIRDGSFDSTCSDLGLDLMASNIDSNTLAYIEKIQSEVSNIRTNVTNLDQVLGSLRTEDDEESNGNKKMKSDNSSSSIKSESHLPSGFDNNSVKYQTIPKRLLTLNAPQYTSSELSDDTPSLEWDSPKHGWSSLPKSHLSRLSEVPGEGGEKVLYEPSPSSSWDSRNPSACQSRASVSDDLLPSLEWDNEALQPYPEDAAAEWDKMPGGDLEQCDTIGTLELDFETELGGRRSQERESMLSCSRSSTISPVTIRMTSSGDASPSESSVRHFVSHSTSGQSDATSVEFTRYRPSHLWSSGESGFLEDDRFDSSMNTNTASIASSVLSPLSPVHEKREPTTSVGSSPSHSPGIHSSTPVSPNWRKPVRSEGRMNSNRDSAYCDGGFDIALARAFESIGEKMDILAYAESEWQGHTEKAERIRQGYTEITTQFDCHHLRRVRGDNYCSLRATLFQVLSRNYSLPRGGTTYTTLETAWRNGYSWLENWSFANRLPFSGTNVLEGMRMCLDSLDNFVNELRESNTRQSLLLSTLNTDPDLDIQLMEALKLHLLAAAMDLQRNSNSGINIPDFAQFLFHRDVSQTSEQLMNTRLNNVGDATALDDTELCLLGYTLSVSIWVIKPSEFGTDEYISCYPDQQPGCPTVLLVTEDDRHYNVVVK